MRPIPASSASRRRCRRVLDELGVGATPRITVYNKVDLLDADLRADAQLPDDDRVAFVSARTGEGTDELLQRIADALRGAMVPVDEVVPYERGELVARARTAGDVTEGYTEGGIRVSGHLPASIAGELTAASAAGRRSDAERSVPS